MLAEMCKAREAAGRGEIHVKDMWCVLVEATWRRRSGEGAPLVRDTGSE